MTGFAIFGHGSVVESANDAVRAAAGRFAVEGGYDLVEASFLELGKPDLPTAAETLISRGATRIVVVPYFLTSGKHLKVDLPRIVAGIQGIHPGMEITVTEPLDGHPALASILIDRARSAV
ncbi:MAG: CbiX/SirB N-terminal domain-containing protein [Bryobacteraceae bacterium]